MDADRRISLMGVVNLTGDSYFPPSRVLGADGVVDEAAFCPLAEKMLAEGADILDLGAVSTRPGAADVPAWEEWRRLGPAVRMLREHFPGAVFSVDTFRSSIVRRVFDTAGPFIVNDISAGEDDPAMLPTVAELGLRYVAMHKRGNPRTMGALTDYEDGVVGAVKTYFEAFSLRADEAGVRDWVLDPGFGFAKTIPQNFELLRHLAEFRAFGRPVLVGISRKRMVYEPLGITPEEALPATQALHFKALEAGADILRVHDVADAARTVTLYRNYHHAATAL